MNRLLCHPLGEGTHVEAFRRKISGGEGFRGNHFFDNPPRMQERGSLVRQEKNACVAPSLVELGKFFLMRETHK